MYMYIHVQSRRKIRDKEQVKCELLLKIDNLSCAGHGKKTEKKKNEEEQGGNKIEIIYRAFPEKN